MDSNQNNTTPPLQGNNDSPTQESSSTSPAPKNSGGVGPVVGIIIIIILLIAGGLYVWGTQINEQSQINTEDASSSVPSDTSPPTPANNDPSRIEGDLNEFDTATFEAQLQADLEQIESEF
ncbi:hypothetical protein CL652_00850 [bacterium]|nr:hypothetical protein [bacterium]|tara:strand:+ start:1645 stop:2007 length:363 start_codon:yes stop_codon:yes gene_type:complete